MLICLDLPGKRISKKVTNISSQEALYLIKRLWNFSEKQNFNKKSNLQGNTYFPLQNILSMILTRRVNNKLEI